MIVDNNTCLELLVWQKICNLVLWLKIAKQRKRYKPFWIHKRQSKLPSKWVQQSSQCKQMLCKLLKTNFESNGEFGRLGFTRPAYQKWLGKCWYCLQNPFSSLIEMFEQKLRQLHSQIQCQPKQPWCKRKLWLASMKWRAKVQLACNRPPYSCSPLLTPKRETLFCHRSKKKVW